MFKWNQNLCRIERKMPKCQQQCGMQQYHMDFLEWYFYASRFSLSFFLFLHFSSPILFELEIPILLLLASNDYLFPRIRIENKKMSLTMATTTTKKYDKLITILPIGINMLWFVICWHWHSLATQDNMKIIIIQFISDTKSFGFFLLLFQIMISKNQLTILLLSNFYYTICLKRQQHTHQKKFNSFNRKTCQLFSSHVYHFSFLFSLKKNKKKEKNSVYVFTSWMQNVN